MPIYDLECKSCGRLHPEAVIRNHMATGDEAEIEEITCECGSSAFRRCSIHNTANRTSRWKIECNPYYRRGSGHAKVKRHGTMSEV